MKILLAICLLFIPALGYSACHVITPSGSGSHTGADWNNALAGVPSSGSLIRGDIYYLADGTYPPVSLNTADSGTATIEFRKAIASDNCTSTGWNTSTMGSAQAVFQNNSPGAGVFGLASDYWIVNGNGSQSGQGCGGAPGSTVAGNPPTPSDCGIKIDNSTCSSGTANACNNPIYLSDYIDGRGIVGITFKYVELKGNGDNNSDEFEVWDPYGGANVGGTWNHIYAHNAGCVFWQDGLDGISITNSYIWGTEVNGATGGCHGQAMFSAGADSNGIMANNIWRDITGTAVWTFANFSTTHNNWQFYNNVIWNTTPNVTLGNLSDGVIACINSGTNCTNFTFMQNTIINVNNPGINNENTGNYTVENNLYYHDVNVPNFAGGTGGSYTQDHNSCLAIINGGTCPSGTANVTNTGAANPFVNYPGSNFSLVTDSSDYNNRVTLGSPYNVDAAGHTFTTDRGAYQYVSGGGGTLALLPTILATSETGMYIALTGTGTSWTSGTPGSPTFTLSGTACSKTAQTVSGNTTALLTINAGGTTGTCTVTDPSTGATATITIQNSSSVVTDSFSGTGALSGNWTNIGTACTRSSGTAVPSSGTGCQGMYSGNLFAANQYSQVVFHATTCTTQNTGPEVEITNNSNTTANGYIWLVCPQRIYKVTSGSGVSSVATCPAVSSGDTIRLSDNAGTLTCLDVTTGMSGSGTDSTYTSGWAGINIDQSTGGGDNLTAFQAGTYSTLSASPTVMTTGTTGNSIVLTGSGTSWTSGTPGSPTFTKSGTSSCSITAQTVASGTSATLTVNAGATTGTCIITDPSTSNTVTINVNTVRTWYIRPDGGTRYSASEPTGQCNGLADASYASTGGTGTNQACAFNDIRFLWATGAYVTTAGCPDWCWVISGGDTVIIRANGSSSWRIGQSGPNSSDGYLGLWGSPVASGAPPPPSGTSSQHTKILGENYAACTSPSAKVKINGGYSIGATFALNGSSYVDVACMDITDFSSCGRSGQANACSTSYPLSDYANNGIETTNTTTNTTLTDINIHGMAGAGMLGATGTGVTVTRVAVTGNASSGWNMDDGSGATGTGTLNLSNFATVFNGCAEVYPISTTMTIPNYTLNNGLIGQVGDCTDDNDGGYGDGIGTATVTSSPAWIFNVSNSLAAYNTQDGFDLLHLQGGGSTLTINASAAYGNMGQQLKVGAAGTAYNNLLVGNCNALRQSIPGAASGFNTNLSDFCRAGDTAVVMSVSSGNTTKYLYNTLLSATATGLEISLNGTCDSTCLLQYKDNVFLGFTNNSTNGYPSGGTGNNSNPIYFDSTNPFGNSGSAFTNNATYNGAASWTCPATNESNAICTDPGLTDETWHLYGIGNMAPASGSILIGNGVAIAGITTDYNGKTRATPPTIGAEEPVNSTSTSYSGKVVISGKASQ